MVLRLRNVKFFMSPTVLTNEVAKLSITFCHYITPFNVFHRPAAM